MNDFLSKILAAIHAVVDPLWVPLTRLWKSEPIRILYVIAVGLQAFATLSTGGQPLQAVIQGVFIAVLGELQRQNVYSPATTQQIADQATFQSPGSAVDIGSPPSGEGAQAGAQ